MNISTVQLAYTLFEHIWLIQHAEKIEFPKSVDNQRFQSQKYYI